MTDYKSYQQLMRESRTGFLHRLFDRQQHIQSRPGQIARGLYAPRAGLNVSQNMWLDVYGLDDRAFYDPSTKAGENYWFDEYTKVRPAIDSARNSKWWQAFKWLSPQAPIADLGLSLHRVRNTIDHAAAEFSTDPLMAVQGAWRMGRWASQALRFNRANGSAGTNLPLNLRAARNTHINTVPFNPRGAEVVTAPMVHSPNLQFTDILHQKLYQYYRSRPQLEGRKDLLPEAKQEQLLTNYKPGDLQDTPERMGFNTYINWLMTESNPQHAAALDEFFVDQFGPIGKRWRNSPLSSSGLIRPDQRENPLEGTQVPRRLDGVDEPVQAPSAELTSLGEGLEPGPTTIYDHAVRRHAQLSARQAEAERIALAGCVSYYQDTYGPTRAKQFFNTFRVQDPQLRKQMMDDVRNDPDMQEFLTDWDTDNEGVRSQQLKELISRGRLPSQVDLSDFQGSVYFVRPSNAGQSKVWQSIRNGEIAELPWILKDPKWRRIGISSAADVDPGPEYHFQQHLRSWKQQQGIFDANTTIEDDYGRIFEFIANEQILNGDIESILPMINERPELRDMFFNPFDGNPDNLLHYAIRADRDVLYQLERIKLESMQVSPQHARFSRAYPLIRTPQDVIIGPRMSYNAQDDVLNTGVQNPRTHVEIARAINTLFGGRKIDDYAQIMNRGITNLMREMGYEDPSQVVYDPYRNITYDHDIINWGISRMMSPYHKAADAVTGDRQNELQHIIQGAESFIQRMYLNEMVGGTRTGHGMETMMRRLYNEDSQEVSTLDDKSPYKMSSDYYTAEEQTIKALADIPEFADVETSNLSDSMNAVLSSYPQRVKLGEAVLEQFRHGMPEAWNGELVSSNAMHQVLDAGGILTYTSPVMFQNPSNTWGFQVPTGTVGTFDLLMKNINELSTVQLDRLTGRSFSDRAVEREATSTRNMLSAPIHISDLSITNMINHAGDLIYDYHPETRARELPSILEGSGAAKFFDEFNQDADTLHTDLRTMINKSIQRTNLQLIGDTSLNAQDDMLEHMDSYMWPDSLMTFRLELPDNNNAWTTTNMFETYRDEVRSFFMRHPEVMEVNLRSAYDDIVNLANFKSPEGVVQQLTAITQRLMEDVVPNYEHTIGQDPMVRERLAHLMHQVSKLTPHEVAMNLPEIIDDYRGTVLHMQGQFGSMHDGAMWMTALRMGNFDDAGASRVMEYIQGYTNEYMSRSEALLDRMANEVSRMSYAASTGRSIGSMVRYDLPDSAIQKILDMTGKIDRPIRMSAVQMGRAAKISGHITRLHERLRSYSENPNTILRPEEAQYLQSQLEVIETMREELVATAHDHYFDSLLHIAEDTTMDATDIGRYFNAQSTPMNTIADNPAALALAKSWESGATEEHMRKGMLQLRATGTITESEYRGLQILADANNASMRPDLVDMYFDVYAAHRPDLPSFVIDRSLARSASKYGPEMQQLVQHLRENPYAAEAYVARMLSQYDGNPVRTAYKIATQLDMPLLTISDKLMGEWPQASKNLIQLMATSIQQKLKADQ